MNKDEMIKDIVKTICEFETLCTECEFNTKKYRCSYKAYAEQVYNAGYRKVGEDEIVESMKTYERARQETAREILQDIMTKISSFEVAGLTIKSVDINIDFVKDLAQKYGVELE